MAVDPRAKGSRAEYQVRDLLRKATGLVWERVPGSGGFGASHGLKGDVYLPAATGKIATFTIEIKHYKDEAFNSNIFNTTKGNIGNWWEQAAREGVEMNNKPLLVFKKDRGAWVAGMRQVDYVEIAHLLSCVTATVANKFDDVVVFFPFKDLLENAQEHLYR